MLSGAIQSSSPCFHFQLTCCLPRCTDIAILQLLLQDGPSPTSRLYQTAGRARSVGEERALTGETPADANTTRPLS